VVESESSSELAILLDIATAASVTIALKKQQDTDKTKDKRPSLSCLFLFVRNEEWNGPCLLFVFLPLRTMQLSFFLAPTCVFVDRAPFFTFL
jgi:hypothetical protein